jgi:prepilin-type N-terminal cleavage/methylation domain-containing protein
LRKAFTLVELLVTITIIGMVAGISLGSLSYARQYAAEQKTKSTIAKLDAIIMRKMEEYKTRRIPIRSSILTEATKYYLSLGMSPEASSKAALRTLNMVKLDSLRVLMELELPDRWQDVELKDGPVAIPIFAPTMFNPQIITTEPAVHKLYYRKWSSAVAFLVNSKSMSVDNAKLLVNKNGGAECLYQILASNPNDLEQFNQNEIGDTDGDSLPELIDGWGRPIFFLRWAPGFNRSDIQPNINTTWNDPVAIAQRIEASNNDHDPFDSRNVGNMQWDKGLATPADQPAGWRLEPLIYSAGPDGQYGLVDVEKYIYRGNPYESIEFPENSGNYRGIGAPTGESFDIDNITNHQF